MNLDKYKVFFVDNSSQGIKLTSTSANHVANLAKEYIQQHESVLNNVTFYNEEVALIGTSNQSVLHNGVNDISNIPELLQEVAEAKSLIAWLREAIKAKELLLNWYERNSELEYKEKNPEYASLEVPQEGKALTEDEYYAGLSIKERNRYYSLETEAAVLGKYIHPSGNYSEERKHLAYYIQNPHKINGNGRDTIIYSYTPTIQLEKVDDMFFKLQAKHREVQAQLNSMKYQCEQAIIASKAKVQEEYTKAYSEYMNKAKLYNAQLAEFTTQKLKEIGNYKIIIPDSLKAIYEKVSKLGK